MRGIVHASPGKRSRTGALVVVGAVVSLMCGMGVAAGARGATNTARVHPASTQTITLGSGLAGSGQDLATSLCVAPAVGGTPISTITSDPALGSYTCAPSTPAHPTVVTATGSPWKYWGSPTGVGPGPTSIAGAATKWVGPDSSGTSVSGATTYIYDAEFNIPCLPSTLTSASLPTLSGSMAADNAAYAYLNGHELATMSLADPLTNFTTATAIPSVADTPIPNAAWVQGKNTIHFLVKDEGQVTGLDYSLTIKIPSADQSCAVLKVCKVAGFGVSPGTQYTFNYATQSSVGTVTVPAGPAPGGYCKVIGTSSLGIFTITEPIPAGEAVTSITGIPSGKADLGNGVFAGKLKVGVNEVTYTDEHVPSGQTTGYLEICKTVQASEATPPAVFVFTVGGHNVNVPPGACSPAIQVLSGPVTVTEAVTPQYVMTGCSTLPAANLVTCTPASNTATVTVNPGPVPLETILTITDGPNVPTFTTAFSCVPYVADAHICEDIATVTGNATGGTPTGGVSYVLCPFTTVQVVCSTPPTGTGNPLTPTTGKSATATSGTSIYGIGTTGYFCFHARYNGDFMYAPITDNDATTECIQSRNG